MNEDKVKALFLLAGFEVESLSELANQYWPDCEEYADIRRESPWWLVNPETITTDVVTKYDTGVHAYSYGKAVEYLTNLHFRLTEKPLREATVEIY